MKASQPPRVPVVGPQPVLFCAGATPPPRLRYLAPAPPAPVRTLFSTPTR